MLLIKNDLKNNLLDYLGQDFYTVYDKVANYYDWFHQKNKILSQLYYKMVWGFSLEEYVKKITKWLPHNPDQVIVDIPVGTGILMADSYSQMHDTEFMVVDYSMKMLAHAEKNFKSHDIQRVTYIRAHVGDLPFDDETVDCIVSMSGFDVFEDREGALDEFYRVLRPGGLLIMCFYIAGQRLITDLLMRLILAPCDFIRTPVYRKEHIPFIFSKNFSGKFKIESVTSLRAKVYCKCIKQE